MSKHLDLASLVVILVTLILFVAALFVKGLKHDMLLEAAVFLVSVKLIIMSHINRMHAQTIHEKIDKILATEKSSGTTDSEK